MSGPSSAPDLTPIISDEQKSDSVEEIEQLLKRRKLNIKWGSEYIPSKISRFVIKIFVLRDCLMGYILDFIVYTGLSTVLADHGLGVSGNILATLAEYCSLENLYLSPKLFLWLLNSAKQ